VQLTSVRYPNGWRVHYTYGAGGGIADDLSRVDAIRDDDSGSPQTGWAFAKYAYNGAGRIVVEDFEQPDVRLDYWGQTGDTYAGFDRFGRVVRQLWRDYGGVGRPGQVQGNRRCDGGDLAVVEKAKWSQESAMGGRACLSSCGLLSSAGDTSSSRLCRCSRQ